MNKNILFVTLGTRDVMVAKEDLEEKSLGGNTAELYYSDGRNEVFLARPAGEFIFRHYSKLKEKLNFPILQPALRRFKTKELVFDQVYLVATNQDETQAGRYRLGDSVFFAKVIQEALKKETLGEQAQFPSVNILEVKENVAYLDNMFDFFQKRLNTKAYSLLLDETSQIFLLNQGGIDAINTALMLNLLYMAGERVNILSVNEKTKDCAQLNFSTQFSEQLERKRFDLALRRFDYPAIQDMMVSESTRLFANYAVARLHFDFERGLEYLQEIHFKFRSLAEPEIVEMNVIKHQEASLIQEVYWNADIKFRQGAYVDFVQRLFRIVEHLAKTHALKHLPGLTDDHNQWKNNFPAFLSKPEYKDLKTYLDGYELKSGKLNYWDSPNIEVFKAILKFFDRDVFSFIQNIQKLANLRNKGIGAHGFEPISLRHILDAMQTDESGFMDLWKEIGVKLEIGANPFERINASLIKTLPGFAG